MKTLQSQNSDMKNYMRYFAAFLMLISLSFGMNAAVVKYHVNSPMGACHVDPPQEAGIPSGHDHSPLPAANGVPGYTFIGWTDAANNSSYVNGSTEAPYPLYTTSMYITAEGATHAYAVYEYRTPATVSVSFLPQRGNLTSGNCYILYTRTSWLDVSTYNSLMCQQNGSHLSNMRNADGETANSTSVVWQLIQDGSYWLIYNPLEQKYVALGDADKNCSLTLQSEVNDKARWEVTSPSVGLWNYTFKNHVYARYLKYHSVSGNSGYWTATESNNMLSTTDYSPHIVAVKNNPFDGVVHYTLQLPYCPDGELIAYHVTYAGNGNTSGTVPTDETDYYEGEIVSVRGSDIAKTGNQFLGWKNSVDTAIYNAGEGFTITGNTTLTAQWTPDIYPISYKDQGDADFTGTNTAALLYSYTYGQTPSLVAAVRAGYTFGGWFTTSACTGTAITKVPAGSIGELTLYAKWTPIQYTLAVASPANVTIKATPAGGSAITEGNSASVNRGTTVTLGYSDLSGAKLQWQVYKTGDVSTVVPVNYSGSNATFVMPEYNTTVNALVQTSLAAMQTTCGEMLQIDGDVWLTSGLYYNTTQSRYEGIPVYTTEGNKNLLTVLSDDITGATKLHVTYYNQSNPKVEVAAGSSPFRLCYYGFAGKSDYIVVATTGDVTLPAGSLYNYSQQFAVQYTPTAAGTTDTYRIQIDAMNGSVVMYTADVIVNGRSLPEKFAIVMKNADNGQWYALPNDLDVSTSAASSTKAPIAVDVDDAENPTRVTYASQKVLYQADSRYAANSHRGAVRMLRYGAGSNAWITTSATSQLYMPDNGADLQQFNLISSDFITYNISQDGATKYVAMNGGTIGWYNEYSTKNIRLLPVDEVLEGVEMDVVDWKKSGSNYTIVFNVTGWNPKQPLTASVNGGAATELTRNADRTVDVALDAQTADSYVTVTLSLGGVVKSTAKYRVPFIYDGGTMSQGSMTSDSYVIVNSGNVSVSGTVAVRDIKVKPDAKLTIPSGQKLAVDRITLRGESWRFPNLENHGTVAAQEFFYTRRVADKDHYYQFGSPYAVQAKDIVLTNGSKPAYPASWILKTYDGASRAVDGKNETTKNWIECGTAAVSPRVGYEMWSNSGYYREYMFPYERARLSDASPANISLVKHEGAAATADPVNGGWNYVVSPLTYDYLVKSVSGFNSSPSAQPKLAEMYEDGQNYYQYPVLGATIRAFSPFYYQAASNGEMTFGNNGALSCTANYLPGANFAPARTSTIEEVGQEQWLQIFIEDANGVTDQTNIYINPKFSMAYETGYDVVKMSTTGSRPFIYTQLPCGDLAFAAIPDSLAETRIPLAVYAAADGDMTFSLRENDWLGRLDHVFLVDDSLGFTTDLLADDYIYSAVAGTCSGRFYLTAEFRAPGVATDVTEVDDGGGNYRVDISEGMITIVDVTVGSDIRMYDAVGRLLFQTKATGCQVSVSVPATGVYLLKVANTVNKVVLDK